MKWYAYLLAIAITALLAGCSSQNPPAGIKQSDIATGVLIGGAAGTAVGALAGDVSIPVTAAMGGIVGGAIATAIDESKTPKETIFTRLEKDHIQVIRIGEDYMLVLPSDVYFFPNSTHMNESMYPAYKDITEFMNHYDIETVKVAGYTDNTGNKIRSLALSRQQADYVAKELWRDNLGSTMVYSTGYGCANPIATNDTKSGQAANRRIQITFRRLMPGS